MGLLKFLLCLFAFIGALAAAGALVICALLMPRFPPLLVALGLACWILCRLMKAFRRKDQSEASRTAPQ